MEIECKPEKIEETLVKVKELFTPVKVLISEKVWLEKFDGRTRDRRTGKPMGSDRVMEFSGVPVEFSDSAGSQAVIVTKDENSEGTKKKAKK